MYVEYEMADTDLRAMGRWVMRNSPYYRRSIRLGSLFMGVLFVPAGVAAGGIGLVLFPAAAVGVFRIVMFLAAQRAAPKANRMGRAVALSGPIVIELNDEGALQRDRSGYTMVRWHAFEAVGSTDDHVFFLIDQVHSMIAPRRAFPTDADWRVFAGFAVSSYDRSLGAARPLSRTTHWKT